MADMVGLLARCLVDFTIIIDFTSSLTMKGCRIDFEYRSLHIWIESSTTIVPKMLNVHMYNATYNQLAMRGCMVSVVDSLYLRQIKNLSWIRYFSPAGLDETTSYLIPFF